jgi:hypothetical protein
VGEDQEGRHRAGFDAARTSAACLRAARTSRVSARSLASSSRRSRTASGGVLASSLAVAEKSVSACHCGKFLWEIRGQAQSGLHKDKLFHAVTSDIALSLTNVMAALLRHVGRREVDGDAFGRKREARGDQR